MFVVLAICGVWSGLVVAFGSTGTAMVGAGILVVATAIGMLTCELFLAIGDRTAEKFVSRIFPPKGSTTTKQAPQDSPATQADQPPGSEMRTTPKTPESSSP
jgi:hypothetical protein